MIFRSESKEKPTFQIVLLKILRTARTATTSDVFKAPPSKLLINRSIKQSGKPKN